MEQYVAAVLLLAIFSVAQVKSQQINCNDHSKLGTPCLHRMCCRNLQKLVRRNCPVAGLQGGQATYNTYIPQGQQPQAGVATYNTYIPQGQQTQAGVSTYNTYIPQGQQTQAGVSPYNTYIPQGQQMQAGVSTYNNYYPQGQQTQAGVSTYNTVVAPQTPGQQQGSDSPMAVRCRTEADYVRQNLTTPAGYVDDKKVAALLRRADPTWDQAMLSKTAALCAAKAASIVEKSGFTTCKSGAYQMTKCMELNLCEFCPASHWNDSPRCREVRQYLRSCPIKPEMHSWLVQPAGLGSM